MTKPATAKILATLVVSVLMFGACGGDNGDNPVEQDDALTKAEYIEQADEICKSAAEDFESLEQPQSVEELEPFVNEAQERTETLIADLRELQPPDEISDDVDTILTNLEQSVDSFPDLLAAAKEQDVETIQQINTEIQENVNAANTAAQDIGLEQCGNTGPTG